MDIIEITEENFDEKVVCSDIPVLVDFWASWCGPCKMLAPVIDEIASERDDIAVGKINVDEQMGLAIKYGVSGVPTVALFKNGDIVERSVGYQSKDELLSELGL
ncbi:MAG: thioredoxin [Lachnospiraceae bacterium]